MAVFVKGSKLNSEIEGVFESAEKCIIIISPFIKLHSRFIEILKSKKSNPNLEIIVVFGKNDNDYSKSIAEESANFLMTFPNINIKYEPRLHAKYYSNESSSVLSSMNLYDFSQNNNIEFGIVTKAKFFGSITSNISNTLDKEAFEYFKTVVNNSECVFHAAPEFENRVLGFSKKYVKSIIKVDKFSNHFNQKTSSFDSSSNPKESTDIGYCIRTGVPIDFNLDRPLTDSAYKSWSKYKDPDYPEKFCHLTGENSDGQNSYAKPVLKKNWKKI